MQKKVTFEKTRTTKKNFHNDFRNIVRHMSVNIILHVAGKILLHSQKVQPC